MTRKSAAKINQGPATPAAATETVVYDLAKVRETVGEFLREYEKQYEAAKAEFLRMAAVNVGQTVSYAGRTIEAEARYTQAFLLNQCVTHSDVTTAAKCYEFLKNHEDRMMDDLLSLRIPSSTSGLDNAVEGVKMEVAARFLRQEVRRAIRVAGRAVDADKLKLVTIPTE